jgi:invasion protein IalB
MKRQNRFAPVRAAWLRLAVATAFALVTGVAISQDATVGPRGEAQPRKSAGPPTAAPMQPGSPEPGGGAAQAPTQLVYSPWTKICGKDPPPANSKVVCLIVKEARVKENRLEIGAFAASAALVESEDETKKILRVILPLGMQIQPGTRVFIDQGPPAQRPYLICFANGCMSDYDADAVMVTKLARGQELVIQAIDSGGQPVTVKLPLADFAKAYDGLPIDPKVLEERQKRLQEEVQGAPKGNAGE